MSEKKKFHLTNDDMPPRLPIMPTLFWWMFLTYVGAPGWLFGAMGVLMLIVWIAVIHKMATYESKSAFED